MQLTCRTDIRSNRSSSLYLEICAFKHSFWDFSTALLRIGSTLDYSLGQCFHWNNCWKRIVLSKGCSRELRGCTPGNSRQVPSFSSLLPCYSSFDCLWALMSSVATILSHDSLWHFGQLVFLCSFAEFDCHFRRVSPVIRARLLQKFHSGLVIYRATCLRSFGPARPLREEGQAQQSQSRAFWSFLTVIAML